MPVSSVRIALDQFTTFGDLLKYLRRRAGITQRELSIAVGYSDTQISRLEQNERLPDLATLTARFLPALQADDQPEVAARLLELAATMRREDAPATGLAPYKGLYYFGESDAELFFGRESLTAALVGKLSTGLATGQRFLAVVGASGSGKSSVVRAGLIPALRWQPASSGWPVYTLTPTAHPLEALAGCLSEELRRGLSTRKFVDDLEGNPQALRQVLERIAETAGAAQILLVVDQFEELFTLCRSETEQAAFVENLLTAANHPGGLAIVIIVLRADFYAHCARFDQLRQALAQHQEYIGPMSAAELRSAIEEPARRGHWEIEPGLVEILLHDLGADPGHAPEPGALPLLSHALLETWQRRRGRTLTMSGYSAAGGVRSAIAETAEAVFFDQLEAEQRPIARQIFLRLTELGGEGTAADTRRRVNFTELAQAPEHWAVVREVLNTLADARLITTDQNTAEVRTRR
jgi:transcriptional regulator with XRE-family HTH domain